MPTKNMKGFARYTISDNGQIVNFSTGCVIKSYVEKKGYEKTLIVADNGKKTNVIIHRAVAINFIPNPDNKPHVNHIDGNKRNNHVSNLEWCTVQENITHAVNSGLANIKGERNHFSVLTESAVMAIRGMGKYSTYKQMASDYNMSANAIVQILKRKTWKHI